MKNKKIFNNAKDFFLFLVGLLLIIFAILISIRLFNVIIDVIKSFIKIYPTITVALITGGLAFMAVPAGKYFENRYTIKSKIREEKQAIYVDFLDWLINNILLGNISNNKNVVEELKIQQKKMTIYASDKVLKAWADLVKVSKNSTINDYKENEEKTKYYINEQTPYIEKLILEIRKELGYKNKNIKQYDIIRLYINDLDDYLH